MYVYVKQIKQVKTKSQCVKMYFTVCVCMLFYCDVENWPLLLKNGDNIHVHVLMMKMIRSFEKLTKQVGYLSILHVHFLCR